MSIRNLKYLFQPRSVAVVGASNRPQSVGYTVMRNLLLAGHEGPILPVNPQRTTVAGVLAYPDPASLPVVPDLAVICTPPTTVPGLISDLGSRGTRAAIVLSAGFDEASEETGQDIRQATLNAARPHLLRILGPNCVGFLAPHEKLNASFAQGTAMPGKIAFVSQSGALATAVLDWANDRNIGFSHFVSLGNCWDVDFGDVLDYLGGDPHTRAILLYVESISSARKFMSAARAAARNKPVILVKAGRDEDGAAAAASHTGALAGSDEVYDAAIRRAGMLRVNTIEDLFNAAEVLGRDLKLGGERLAVVTNGGGAGVMAADALAHRGGRLAKLEGKVKARLDEVLPRNWSGGNPVDIIGDAPAERYVAAIEALSESREVDAVLLIQAPTAIVPSDKIAQALLPAIAKSRHPVLGCWLGGESSRIARETFVAAGIPTFHTPERAVGGFMQLVDYRRNQTMLAETPQSVPDALRSNRLAARTVIEEALAAGRAVLSEPEAKAVLSCYNIPIIETRIVADADQAVAAAEQLGYPVALKILSDDISHKSDVGGVVLDIEDPATLSQEVAHMSVRVANMRPEARITGFTVQRLARRPHAIELIVGAKTDRVFGPVVLFGQGGTSVEVTADRAVGLPPMNLALAQRLVAETRVSRLLAGYRDRASVRLDQVYASIIQVGQLMIDFAEIDELDINPLLADSEGVIALDARIKVRHRRGGAMDHLAIRPYPRELEETVTLGADTLVLRPIRPEDEPQHRAFLEALEPEDIRFRFFGTVRRFDHSQIARLTQIDFDREMAFIAVKELEDGERETLGVVRVVSDPDNVEAEFAIIVQSRIKGRGLGTILLNKAIDYCRKRGLERIVGQILAENRKMLALAERLGFEREASQEPGVVQVKLELTGRAAAVKRAKSAA